MKIFAVLTAWSLLSANDPGCGAGVGANVANGPGSSTTSATDGGAATLSGNASGAAADPSPGTPLPQAMTCGALGAHFFCETFDTGAVPGAFDSIQSTQGTVSFDGTRATSAPRSLLASTLAVTSSTRTFARLERTFTPKASRFTLSFAEYVDPACIGPFDGVDTGVISLKSDTYFVAVRHGGSDSILETSLSGGIFSQAHVLKHQLPRGAWAHVTLEVDVAHDTLDLSVDGEKIVENEPLKYPPGSPQSPKLSVGTLTDDLTFHPSACNVNIDDVVLDGQE